MRSMSSCTSDFCSPVSVTSATTATSSSLVEYDLDKYSASFAQPGPMSSYRTLEARMMVCRSLPIVPPSVRAPRAARPMATPACGMRARPR